MSVPAKLIKTYNVVLMANANVRKLVASVSQDPQNETVDLEESQMTVRQAIREIGDPAAGDARRQIIGWLNSLYFSRDEISLGWSFGIPFWWEMHTRIQKLLIVSMIMEGENLRSFGAEPEEMDIPQCLVGLQIILYQMREEEFPKMRATHTKHIKLCEPDFIKLYTKK